MRRREVLGSIGSGVVHSFVSRNNDLEGYWAPGKLYLYVQRAGGLRLTLDLLNAADPALAHPLMLMQDRAELALVAERTRIQLHRQLRRRGAPAHWLAGAMLAIDFGCPRTQAWQSAWGAPFRCALTLIDDLGTVHTLRAGSICRPHDPHRETRRAASRVFRV